MSPSRRHEPHPSRAGYDVTSRDPDLTSRSLLVSQRASAWLAAWAFAAASMMTAATALGCDSIGTWLAFSSVVVAFMRVAKKRSSSGAIAWSSVETMYHDGFVFQATPETCAPNADAAIGPCVAAATRASLFGRSDPNFSKASVDSVRKPLSSTFGAASAGGGGYFFPSSPTCSP